jgi:hypothetical protein
MAVTENRVTASCSFCLKPDHEVGKLIAGPGVFICNECVHLCSQIIDCPPSLPPALTSWEEDLDLDGVLASLPRMAAAGHRSKAISPASSRGRGRSVQPGPPSGCPWG